MGTAPNDPAYAPFLARRPRREVSSSSTIAKTKIHTRKLNKFIGEKNKTPMAKNDYT